MPGEPAAEPIAVDGPEALLELGAAFGVDGKAVHPLRDATCRSYPVWVLSRSLCARIESLTDAEIDGVAAKWQPRADADLYERATCVGELQAELRRMQDGERLFALLEERAF